MLPSSAVEFDVPVNLVFVIVRYQHLSYPGEHALPEVGIELLDGGIALRYVLEGEQFVVVAVQRQQMIVYLLQHILETLCLK